MQHGGTPPSTPWRAAPSGSDDFCPQVNFAGHAEYAVAPSRAAMARKACSATSAAEETMDPFNNTTKTGVARMFGDHSRRIGDVITPLDYPYAKLAANLP